MGTIGDGSQTGGATPGPPSSTGASTAGSGAISADGGSSAAPVSTSTDASGAPACVESPSPQLLRQLTFAEYRNTVTDLLRISNPDTTNIPADGAVRDFTTNVTGAFVDDAHMSAYQSVGAALAARAVTESYATLVPCTTQDAACATAFVSSFGLRAFRRPLTSDETARYAALLSTTLTGGNFQQGVALAINAMVISPNFLFRSELGSDPAGQGQFVLTAFEVASALSYTYWGTMPDDALFAAAQSGALTTKPQIEAQARRLLADPRGRAHAASFFYEWLESPRAYIATKDMSTYPVFTDPTATGSIVDAMRAEEDAFITNVVFDSTRKFSELFTANYTFVNDRLASYYGLAVPGSGSVPAKVILPAGSTRGGLLTLGMFLFGHARTNESSPTQRGHLIRANILCQDIPPPPPGVNPVVMDGTPGKTAREQILALTSTGICVSCHSLQDPIGFGLEGFDGVGEPRTLDNGEAVDTSGQINAFASHPSGPLLFNGVKELSNILAASAQARACLATNYHRYARGFDAYAQPLGLDACAADTLGQNFSQNDLDIPELFVQVALQDSFTTRRSAEVVAR